ncbi:YitT family protein [Fusibacter paucivorans]|uniref:YitT family protein n=1 Tax=Fusibacter paucivorans TaxID=76009 RepID=A0ABS5PJ56_9FIRM|nr:YitT family protein [Fusibacter paucivorans]MBS7525129.1 YitT family protein [Fusibacter paucivorans]
MIRHFDRWLLLVFGTMVAALGMSMITASGLGNVTLTVLWDGMHRHSPLSIGAASYVTSLLMILFSLVFDRSQVRLGTVVHFLLFGAFMDIFNAFQPQSSSAVWCILEMSFGILLLGIGIGLYAYADLGRGPYEGIGFAIADKTGIELKYVRTLLDGLFALIGFLMGGLIGIATIANLLVCGYIIQRTMGALSKKIHPVTL